MEILQRFHKLFPNGDGIISLLKIIMELAGSEAILVIPFGHCPIIWLQVQSSGSVSTLSRVMMAWLWGPRRLMTCCALAMRNMSLLKEAD